MSTVTETINHSEPDMLLPEGFTCAECWLFKKCESFGVAQEKNTICDFSPSKFHLDTDKYISIRTRVSKLEEALKRISELHQWSMYSSAPGIATRALEDK